MLKGRGKIFAPKKVSLRKPGQAPASAPTSVQPQLQTPAPTQQPEELPTILDKDNVSPISEVQCAGTGTQSDQPASSSSNPSTTSTSAPQLKRKEQEEDVPTPIAKRHISEADRPVFRASVAPMVEKEPSDLPTNPITAPTVDVSVPNTPTRKDRAPVPYAPSSKSVPGAQSLNSGSQSSPNTPPVARTEELHEHNTSQNTNQVPTTAQDHDPPPQNTRQVPHSVSLACPPGNSVVENPIGASNRAEGSSDVVEPASLNPDGTAESVIGEPAVATGKAKRKAKGKKAAGGHTSQEGNDAEGSQAASSVSKKAPRARRAAVPRRPRKMPDATAPERRRRVRAATPDDASDQEIDPEVITMGDLTKDLKIGKKFSRYAEIKEMEERKKQEAAKARMRRTHPEMASLIEPNGGLASEDPNVNPPPGDATTSAAEGEAAAADEHLPSPEPPQGLVSGPRMRLLNGRMILDETSLQIDRHANAQLQREGMETVEENDFSRLVNQGTFMKREPSQAWDTAANQLFYKGLRQFGTDFEMIASMFPHRNRRQIKLKFNKEEKVNAAKINRILINPKDPIDLEEWEKMADKKLESLEVIHAEREKYDAEQREEIAKFTDAAAEATRRKKESIKGSEAARRAFENMSDESEAEGGFGGSNKENGKGKKKTPAKKRGWGKNDDPGEIVGMVD